MPGAQMHDLFHMAGDGNMEKIFEFNYVNNPGNDPNFSDALDHFQVNQSCFWSDLYLPSNTIQAVGRSYCKRRYQFFPSQGLDSYL